MTTHLTTILSLFPGAGIMDHGFTLAGFCVLRGPEIMLGQNIQDFHIHAGVVTGIIAGPPCQDFSAARRSPPTGYGLEMLRECARIILEAQPVWWLVENVPGVPNVIIPKYTVSRFNLTASEFGSNQRRNRAFQFGYSSGPPLSIFSPGRSHFGRTTPAVLTRDVNRPLAKLRELQGLPADHRMPLLSRVAQTRLIGNGCAVPVALAIAQAIRDRYTRVNFRTCVCGCGRVICGPRRKKAFSAACRKRLQRANTLPAP